MSVTDELNQWIAEHGSERDALNVALARLHLAEAEVERLRAVEVAALTQSEDVQRNWLSPVEVAGLKAEVERLNAEADHLTVALAQVQDAKAHIEREYLAFVMEAVGHEFTEPS